MRRATDAVDLVNTPSPSNSGDPVHGGLRLEVFPRHCEVRLPPREVRKLDQTCLAGEPLQVRGDDLTSLVRVDEDAAVPVEAQNKEPRATRNIVVVVSRIRCALRRNCRLNGHP